MNRWAQGTLLAGAIALCYCVLSFYQATDAAPRGELPFANAVEQRMETINELREIRALLKEQNALVREQIALLRSGEVKVAVVAAEAQAARPAEQ